MLSTIAAISRLSLRERLSETADICRILFIAAAEET
jgi:hypothetical protein